jgi:uncharacterized protein YjiK
MRYFFLLLALVPILSFAYLKNKSASEIVENSLIDLADYKIVHVKSVENITENLSGITYSPDSSTLFAVINNPEQIIELSKSGQIIRKIAMQNFHDTEGIAHIAGDSYAIIQETSRTISIVTISDDTVELDANAFRQFNISDALVHNGGLEGVAWSVNTGLYVANEHSPNEVIHLPLSLFNQTTASNIGNVMPHYFKDLPVDDISGLHFSELDQLLFVLSHESRSLLAVNKQGEVTSRFNFDRTPFGFSQSISQPEGITVDKKNNIYVVGEPNIFMVLAPKTTTEVRQTTVSDLRVGSVSSQQEALGLL